MKFSLSFQLFWSYALVCINRDLRQVNPILLCIINAWTHVC